MLQAEAREIAKAEAHAVAISEGDGDEAEYTRISALASGGILSLDFPNELNRDLSAHALPIAERGDRGFSRTNARGAAVG
jgi:hypothetical protein